MPQLPVGDKGQRYEVRYADSEGVSHVFGWAPTQRAAKEMAKTWLLRPSTDQTIIWDREKGRVILTYRKG